MVFLKQGTFPTWSVLPHQLKMDCFKVCYGKGWVDACWVWLSMVVGPCRDDGSCYFSCDIHIFP